MAITFPAGAAGAEYTNPTTGVKYYWDTTDEVWKTHVWPTNTNYLQLSGGTLTGDLSLGTNDLTAQDITTTGAVSVGTGLTVGNGLTVSDGNVVMASGHGIDFSATADPSSNLHETELFDDYEEGFWTPTFQYLSGSNWTNVSFDTTPISQGRYVKVGNVVHFSYYSSVFNVASAAATELARIAGLPYNQKTAGTNSAAYTAVKINHTTCFEQSISGGYVEVGNDTIRPTREQSTATATWADGNVYLMIAGTYQTN